MIITNFSYHKTESKRQKMKFPLEQKIGIIGGGQLGKMLIQAASKLDFHITILDPTPDCPASSLADEHIVASFDNAEALRKLVESVGQDKNRCTIL